MERALLAAPADTLHHGSKTHGLQAFLEGVPGGLHHLEGCVVLDVLDKVQHALLQSEGASKPGGQEMQMAHVYLGRVLRLP